MKVHELIKALQGRPPDDEVSIVFSDMELEEDRELWTHRVSPGDTFDITYIFAGEEPSS